MPLADQFYMKKVLIIGASGSLGSGVINNLSGNYQITGTYVNNRPRLDSTKFIQLDITQKEQFAKLDNNFDVVFLIAGAMPAMMRGYDPSVYIDVNIQGALNVLEYCHTNSIKKLIYVMTFSDVSSEFYSGIPIKDDAQRTLPFTGDHSVYAISKIAACDLIEHYHQEHGIQTIIFRIPTIYCNDDNFNYYANGKLKSKAYIEMIRSIVNNHSIDIWGNPNNAKDMPYIKDFCTLIEKAIEHKTAQGVFNAGTANPVSLEQLVNVMIEVFSPNYPVEKHYLPNKPSQPNFTFSMQKTNSVFDFEPEWNVRDMFFDIEKSLGINKFIVSK